MGGFVLGFLVGGFSAFFFLRGTGGAAKDAGNGFDVGFGGD